MITLRAKRLILGNWCAMLILPSGLLATRAEHDSIHGDLAMKRVPVLLLVVVVAAVSSAHAASFGGPGGSWPKDWPKELEPFRKNAWTWEHGLVSQVSYDIPFANREEFETVWPHILKLKSKEAPLTLVNPDHYHGKAGDVPASVVVFPPLKGSKTGPMSGQSKPRTAASFCNWRAR